MKQILGFNNDDATMDEIFRIFENYESRKRPFIGERLNVTGWVLNQNWYRKTKRENIRSTILFGITYSHSDVGPPIELFGTDLKQISMSVRFQN